MTPYAKIHKQVRAITAEEGWGAWCTYNDLRKDGSRRICYYNNGYRIPYSMKDAIRKRTEALLRTNNLPGTVYWHVAYRGGYSDYDKLCIVVPA